MHTNDEALIREAIGIMKANGSLEYAQGVARKLVEDAWNNVAQHLPENAAREKLRLFADYLITRKI